MSLPRVGFLVPALLLASCAKLSQPPRSAAPPSPMVAATAAVNKEPEDEPKQPIPTVIVDERVRRLTLTNLRVERNELIAEISGATDELKARDLIAEQFDASDNKLSESIVHFPPLKPGQSGRFWMFLKRGVTRIYIRPRYIRQDTLSDDR